MKVIFNDKMLSWQQISLSPTNRGFRYGDGFFETIAVIAGAPRFLDKHLERLQNGAKTLRLDVADFMDLKHILDNIKTLQAANNLLDDAKLRLIIWRDSAGLFTPANGNTHYLLTLEEAKFDKKPSKIHAGFSESVINYPSQISRFKTMSAAKYVLAGIEKKECKLDEIIISDHQGFVSEALSSNIFWKIKEVYGTPPITTGCVEGIMRNWLIQALTDAGYKVEEQLITPKQLIEAEHIFTSNSMGIRHISALDSYTFDVDVAAQKCVELIN